MWKGEEMDNCQCENSKAVGVLLVRHSPISNKCCFGAELMGIQPAGLLLACSQSERELRKMKKMKIKNADASGKRWRLGIAVQGNAKLTFIL